MEIQHNKLPEKSIQKILEFLPYFSDENNFGEWKGGDETEDGVKTFPYFIYSNRVSEFINTLYETDFIVVFNWSNWDEGRVIISDKNLIQKSDLLSLRMLITYIVRNDRFCEGSLQNSIEDKTILTILKRLNELKNTSDCK